MHDRDLGELCYGNRAAERYFCSLPPQMQLCILDSSAGADAGVFYSFPEPTDVEHRAVLLPGRSDFLFPFRG